MEINKTTQENITAQKVAGRDAVDNTYTININRNGTSKYMEDLIAKFKVERATNVIFNDIIDDLQHYSTPIDDNVVGVEAKLVMGNREADIPFAIATKEKFYRKLKKNEYSESAQEIYAFVMAEIFSNFNRHIYPLIKENKPKEFINIQITELVIVPVQIILGENILRILADDINGMLFYLTGNCHIKWI